MYIINLYKCVPKYKVKYLSADLTLPAHSLKVSTYHSGFCLIYYKNNNLI